MVASPCAAAGFWEKRYADLLSAAPALHSQTDNDDESDTPIVDFTDMLQMLQRINRLNEKGSGTDRSSASLLKGSGGQMPSICASVQHCIQHGSLRRAARESRRRMDFQCFQMQGR